MSRLQPIRTQFLCLLPQSSLCRALWGIVLTSSLILPIAEAQEELEQEESLEEIIVISRKPTTVGKLDAPLRDQPQNVTVISRAVLDNFGKARIEDISYATVGVQAVAPQYGVTSLGFFARGFNGGTVVVDGYYSSNGAFGSQGTYDMAIVESVEILRGPAAILYGQGNPAGVINLTSKRPESEFFAGVNVFADSHGGRRIEVDTTGALSNTVNGRVVMVYEDSDLFRDFVTQERKLVAPSLSAQFGDVTLRAHYVYDDFAYLPDNGPGFNGDLIQNLDAQTNIGEPWQPMSTILGETWRLEADWNFASDWTVRFGYYDQETTRPDGLFEIDADCIVGDPECFGSGSGTLVDRAFITTIDPNNNSSEHYMLSGQLLGKFDLGPTSHILSAAVESTRSLGKIDFDFGFISPIDYANPMYDTTMPPLVGGFIGDSAGRVAVDAAYVQDLISFGERWKVLLGVRKDDIVNTRYFDPDATMLRDRTERSKTTPRLGVVYSPTDMLTLFASYSEAFSPQRGENRFGQSFEPEDSRSYEIGVRKEIDSRLFLWASVYDIEKENILLVDPVDTNFNITAGVAQSTGAEIGLQGRITPNLWLNTGLSYFDARITESVDPASFPVGDELPGASPLTILLGMQYEFDNGLGIGANIAYGSEREYRVPNSPVKLEAYNRIDLYAEYAFSDSFDIQVNINNLTDERILMANGFGRAQFDQTQTVSARFRYRYQ